MSKATCPWPIPQLVDKEEDQIWLGWLQDLKKRDFDEVLRQTRTGQDPSIRLIYELSGIEVLAHLWKHHMSTALYVSEAPLNELRKMHIRRFYDPSKPETSVKVLATRLTVSEQFVREALGEKPEEDPRQEKLFKEEKAS